MHADSLVGVLGQAGRVRGDHLLQLKVIKEAQLVSCQQDGGRDNGGAARSGTLCATARGGGHMCSATGKHKGPPDRWRQGMRRGIGKNQRSREIEGDPIEGRNESGGGCYRLEW